MHEIKRVAEESTSGLCSNCPSWSLWRRWRAKPPCSRRLSEFGV